MPGLTFQQARNFGIRPRGEIYAPPKQPYARQPIYPSLPNPPPIVSFPLNNDHTPPPPPENNIVKHIQPSMSRLELKQSDLAYALGLQLFDALMSGRSKPLQKMLEKGAMDITMSVLARAFAKAFAVGDVFGQYEKDVWLGVLSTLPMMGSKAKERLVLQEIAAAMVSSVASREILLPLLGGDRSLWSV